MWLVTSSTWAPSMPGAVDLRRFSPTTTGGGSLGDMQRTAQQLRATNPGSACIFPSPPPQPLLFGKSDFVPGRTKQRAKKARFHVSGHLRQPERLRFLPLFSRSACRGADRQTCLGRLAGCPTGCRGPACCNGLLESLFVAIHPSSLERFAASPPSASCNAPSAALASSEHAALKSFLGWLTSPANSARFSLVKFRNCTQSRDAYLQNALVSPHSGCGSPHDTWSPLMAMPARLLLLFCLSTPVAAPNWNETRSRLKGAAHCCGIPAVARVAKSAWAPRSASRTGRSARAPVQQTTGFLGELAADRSLPPDPLQANSEADFVGWLRIGLLLWLAGLGCVVFLVGRLWFTYSGYFFNWLLRGSLLC